MPRNEPMPAEEMRRRVEDVATTPGCPAIKDPNAECRCPEVYQR